MKTEIGNCRCGRRTGEKKNDDGIAGGTGNHTVLSSSGAGGSWGVEERSKYKEVEMMPVDGDCTYTDGILGILPSIRIQS